MLDPNYILHISEGAEDIAEKLHNQIIKRIVERIMLRIGRGDDYILTSQDKWQIQTLQDAGFLLEDIQKDIAQATKLQQTEIAEAMEDAGVKALSYDDRIYQEAGITTVPLTESPQLIRLMQRNYDATIGEWTNFTRTTADSAQRLFVNELDRAYNLVATGAMSYTQAVKDVVKNIVSNGVVVDYPTGHSDTIETATLRAVRTGISQASAQIQIARMDEYDVDLVITSSHLGARPSHQVWQGKIFSRSGKGKYPNFAESTGYGSVSGLCGANCRHSFSPYFEGMDNPYEQYDSEENKKQYETEQYQRTLERRIRHTKRETMGLKEAVDNCTDAKAKFELELEYQKKASLLMKQNTAYNEFCESNNLKRRSDRISIAQWDRKQAAQARGAAKRYKNSKKLDISIENRFKSDKIEIRESPPKRIDNRVKVTQERVDSITREKLPNVKFSAPIEVNNSIKDYGQTKIIVPPYGRKKVVKIIIGKQENDSDIELIDSLIHEELEARIAIRSYDSNFYSRLDKASDKERHEYINKVIKRFMKGRFE